MDAALAVSIAAVVIAAASLAVSLIYTRRADARAGRADARAERAETRAEEELHARRRAKPIITPGQISGGRGADVVTYEYRIRNAGKATITALTVWLADDAGEPVSTGGGGPHLVLAPDETPAVVSVNLLKTGTPRRRVMVRWTDADGEHEEDTGIEAPPHA